MKNYTYRHVLLQQGYVEVPESEYTDRQKDMKDFIDDLSKIVKKANCGWDGVEYKVMHNKDMGNEKYMVLYVGYTAGSGERWIPITGNSKGACISALGDNLW